MKAKYFLLGLLLGIMATALAVAVAVFLMVSRPLPGVPQVAPTLLGDMTLSVSEDYLSRLATELLREQDPMIQGVQVDVQPGGRVDVGLGVQATILGQKLDLQIQLISTIGIDDGRVHIAMQRIDLADLGIPLDLLPESLRTTVGARLAEISDVANGLLDQNGMVPVGVTTDQSSITLTLRAQ